MAKIELKHLYKQLADGSDASKATEPPEGAPEADSGSPFVIEDLSLTIEDGEIMVILGPSGCGKSTLLRLIAGLLDPDAGQVLYDGQDMIEVPPNQRQIGMVFQDYALYPQYSAKRNILSFFGFKKKTPDLDEEAQEKYRRTSELMGVELDYLLHKKPAQLSGGEQQRVAIGRCITRNPKLFLMDEPFSNLDQKLRDTYRTRLKRLLQEFAITTVYVTHDQQEALALADRMAIMRRGQIEQVGPPQEIYKQPHNVFVAKFLNFDQHTPAINLLEGSIVSSTLAGTTVGVRPEDIEPVEAESQATVLGQIVDLQPLPIEPEQIATIQVGDTPLSLRLPATKSFTKDIELKLRFAQYHVFEPQTGRRQQTHRASEEP